MVASTQRGARVLYVAGSAREFPQDVQEWLGCSVNRAAASPSIYDVLATLTRRPRPVAIIISIGSVDWEEMEFFDLAMRLSRDTSIYVAGHTHHRAKIEAALQRGAKRFNDEELAQDLVRSSPASQRPTPRDLLAGTLQSFPQAPARQLHVTLVPEEAPATEQNEADTVVEPATDDNMPDTPPVRFISPAEEDTESLTAVDDFDRPIPFPWAPSANRPKRTPPSAHGKGEVHSQADPRTPPTAEPQAKPASRSCFA